MPLKRTQHKKQSDWNQQNTSQPDYIKNKPAIPASQQQTDWSQGDNTKVDYIKNKPAIPDAQIQSDFRQGDPLKADYIKNRPAVDEETALNLEWRAAEASDFAIIELYAPYPYTIEGIAVMCDLGTANLSVWIDNNEVEFNESTAVPVTTEKTKISSTGANIVTTGRTIRIFVNSIDPTTTRLYITLNIKGIVPVTYQLTKYGALYNRYAISSGLLITSNDDWYVLEDYEWQALINQFGGDMLAGDPLKESGTEFWNEGNEGTNESELRFRGSGYRHGLDGVFTGLKTVCEVFSYNEDKAVQMVYNYGGASVQVMTGANHGMSVRLARNRELYEVGLYGEYTGNDGKKYTTKVFAFSGVDENGPWEYALEIMLCHLAETQFRDNSIIPIVEDNAAWAALQTSGMCYYENDITNC